MSSTNIRNGLSAAQNHELKVALCFWVLVAGVALVIANALAAAGM